MEKALGILPLAAVGRLRSLGGAHRVCSILTHSRYRASMSASRITRLLAPEFFFCGYGGRLRIAFVQIESGIQFCLLQQ